MEPINVIVAAFAAGAAISLKATAELSAIKKDYDALKAYLQHRYDNVDISVLEKRPGSKPRQQVLAEELSETDVRDDVGLLKLASNLLELIQQRDPAVMITVGIDLNQLKAEHKNPTPAEDGEFTGGIDIRSVLAGKNKTV